ncbi:hypothetical protein [Exiguobacterium sp. SH0S2]|uniref:hypothetical protein n=1 Tax=Exiguobacterium sp. SH0S2 TaxID=2510950 RepID=UPI001F462B53|nr:hypothetical protein [Exiguobacterium sp. SH0S2]
MHVVENVLLPTNPWIYLESSAKERPTLEHEVASERITEQYMTSERHLFDWLDEQRLKLSPRHFELLCHLIDGTEQTLAYSASRLRAYKADVQRELRENLYSKE